MTIYIYLSLIYVDLYVDVLASLLMFVFNFYNKTDIVCVIVPIQFTYLIFINYNNNSMQLLTLTHVMYVGLGLHEIWWLAMIEMNDTHCISHDHTNTLMSESCLFQRKPCFRNPDIRITPILSITKPPSWTDSQSTRALAYTINIL